MRTCYYNYNGVTNICDSPPCTLQTAAIDFSNAGCTATECTDTFFVQLTPADGAGPNNVGLHKLRDQVPASLAEGFVLVNQLPNQPSNLALDPNNDGVNGPSLGQPFETHSETPTASWTATDNDNGLVRNRWPADILTGHIEVTDEDPQAGPLITFYDDNDAANPAGTVLGSITPIDFSNIPLSSDDKTAHTVYANIWSTDEHDADNPGVVGISPNYYPNGGQIKIAEGQSPPANPESLAVVDYLPDVTLIEITGQDAVTEGPLVYNDCDGPGCSIDPRYEPIISADHAAVTVNRAAVNARITVSDLDEDCFTAGDIDLYLCETPSSSGVVCDDNLIDGGFSYLNIPDDGIISGGGSSLNCRYEVQTAKGAVGNPPFFLAADTYKLHADATSQSGAYRATDPGLVDDDSTWIYNTNIQIDYPYDGVGLYQSSGAQVDLGDSQVQAGSFNHGENQYTAYNHGNNAAGTATSWQVTDPCISTRFDPNAAICIEETDAVACNLLAGCTYIGTAPNGNCVQDACNSAVDTSLQDGAANDGELWELGEDSVPDTLTEPDFQADDDTNVLTSDLLGDPGDVTEGSETGLSAVQMPNPAATVTNPVVPPRAFPPSPVGLCNNLVCSLTGFFDTFWHIKPSTGLSSATYKSKITITSS